jgi:hypothetical protein
MLFKLMMQKDQKLAVVVVRQAAVVVAVAVARKCR